MGKNKRGGNKSNSRKQSISQPDVATTVERDSPVLSSSPSPPPPPPPPHQQQQPQLFLATPAHAQSMPNLSSLAHSDSADSLDHHYQNHRKQKQAASSSAARSTDTPTFVLTPITSASSPDLLSTALQAAQQQSKNLTPTAKQHQKSHQHQNSKKGSTSSSSSSPDSNSNNAPRRPSSPTTTTSSSNNNNDNVEGYFVPIIALTSERDGQRERAVPDHPEGTESASHWNTLMRLFGGLVLVGKIQWSNALLWIASYQYIPLMAAVAVTTANCMLATLATSILPVIEYEPEGGTGDALLATGSSSSSSSVGGTTSATTAERNYSPHWDSGLGSVWVGLLLSFLIVLGTVVSGYKVASMVGDAFLDSCRIVVDKRSHFTLLLYSLYRDLCRIFALGPKYVAVFVFWLVGLPTLLLMAVMNGKLGIDKRPAFLAAFASATFEVVWLIFQIVRFLIRIANGTITSSSSSSSSAKKKKKKEEEQQQQQQQNQNQNQQQQPPTRSPVYLLSEMEQEEKNWELENELGVWWARKIPKMRRRGFTILFFTGVLITLGSGLLNGIIALVEGFLYVSFLHLSAHVSARTTLFIRAVHVTLRTISHDTTALIVTMIIGPVLLGVAIANYFRFGFWLAVIQVPVLVLAMCSVASHANDLKARRERMFRRSRRMLSNGGGGRGGATMTSSSSGSGTMSSDMDSDIEGININNNNKALLLKNKNTGEDDDDEEEDYKLAMQEKNMFSSVFFVLWRVSLLNPRRSFDYGAHWRYARYLRVGLRFLFGIFCIATTSVALWVAIQSVQGAGEVSTLVLARTPPNDPDAIEVYTKDFTLKLTPPSSRARKYNENNNNNKNKNASTSATEQKRRAAMYQGMCQRTWLTSEDEGSDDDFTHKRAASFQTLHVGDTIFFSLLAYIPPKSESFEKVFNFYKKHRKGADGWEVVEATEQVWEPLRTAPSFAKKHGAAIERERREIVRWTQLHLHGSLRPLFFHFRRKRPTTKTNSSSGYDHVFVMRGTEIAYAADFWQNGIIFADVFLIEQLANFVPGVGLLPMEYIRDLVAATNFVAHPPDALYYHTHMSRYMRAVQLLNLMNDEVEQEGNNNNDYNKGVGGRSTNNNNNKKKHDYLAAGHSLGGVVMQLAAPPLGLPAVALSAPGTVYMSRKFGVSSEATEAYVTNLVVSNDLIPLIGTVNGEVHNIYCEHGSSLICHSVQLSFWRVMQYCGEYRRQLFGDVQAEYSMSASPLVESLQALNKWLESIVGFPLHFNKAGMLVESF